MKVSKRSKNEEVDFVCSYQEFNVQGNIKSSRNGKNQKQQLKYLDLSLYNYGSMKSWTT